MPPVVLLSNRGPVSFTLADDGELVARRGAGGLVSGLAPLVAGTDAVWIAAAMSEGDRQAAASGVVEVDDLRVRLLAVDRDTYDASYDVVCNATLWYAHHGLFDLPRRPRHDRRWAQAWDAYRQVNAGFAAATVETAPEGAVVLVQDYHLCLVAPAVRAARPDLRLVHFSHTPFALPEWLLAVPDAAARELLDGMAAHHACTFHTERWAAAFRACCERYGVTAPPTAATPLAADLDDLDSVASSDACAAAGADLDVAFGQRRVIVRVERIELSKNLLRGFLAYDLLLEERPEWREQVVFAAHVYPSREGLADYLTYRQDVESLIARINHRWRTDGWTPILYDPHDDFPRSVAALQRADVLLVNPIRDGLNLVAKEGPLLNQRDGVLVLSTEAGAYDELGDAGAVAVNPFDVAATADALHDALAMPAADRAARAASLRAVVAARGPADWLADQLRCVPDGGAQP
jgi:trehalose 6-phosphate synthase